MIRAGFFVENLQHARLLRRYGFLEQLYPPGKYVKAQVKRPSSFGARTAFEISEVIRKNGWYHLRSNTIHMGTPNLIEPLFHLYLPVA